MSNSFRQKTLPLYATADKTFEQYLVGPNAEAVTGLRGWVAGEGPRYVLLWGPGAVGKSHLVQASLRALDAMGMATMYAPLGVLASHGPESIGGLDSVAAIGIDDLDVVIGDRDWETALFNLFNDALANDVRLLITAQSNPRQFACVLPDLGSRLSAGLIYQLSDLDDDGKRALLQRLAVERDFELPASVAEYIVTRSNRDLGKLCDIFDRIDRASLSSGRRITIPFVRELL